MKLDNTRINLRIVLEYSQLFPEQKDIDVKGILKQYNRLDLIRTVSLFSLKYVDALFPNVYETHHFFSNPQSKYSQDILQRWKTYCCNHYVEPMPFVLPRTTLELVQILLSIPPEEFEEQEDVDREEFDIFRVLIYLNEKIFACELENNDKSNYITNIYLNQFSNNSLNNFSEIDFLSQMVYSKALFEAIETNPHYKHLYQGFLDFWKINSWKEYTSTVLSLFIITGVLKNCKQKGVGLIGESNFPSDGSLLNKTIIDSFSIDCNEICQESVDYKHLRERPIIKIKDFYMPINLQLLSEAMYNGLYFNLQKIYKGKDFNNLYTRSIFEHMIFQRTMWKCLRRYDIAYPPKKEVLLDKEFQEKNSQPDFYIRKGNKTAIFECKAIKMNGSLKELADEKKLLYELRKKLYNKNHGTKETLKAKGVTQLINFIEIAQKHEYEWDKPGRLVSYYPILVLEDSSIIKEGFNTIICNWQKEYIGDKKYEKVKPIIVMSVDILILCASEFANKGFFHFFDKFLSKYNPNGTKDIHIDADFRTFMREECPNCFNFDVFINTAKAVCAEDNVPEPLQKCIDIVSCKKR